MGKKTKETLFPKNIQVKTVMYSIVAEHVAVVSVRHMGLHSLV